MKIGRWIILALVIAGAGFFVWRRFGTSAVTSLAEPAPAVQRLVPEGVRIKVEVLNATKVRGLARRATLYLRDRGFDVVAVGTSRQQQASTLVLDRSGHPEWAALAAKALHAKVESRPDSSGYLDITVLVGGDWHPPALPFYP